MWPRPTGIVFPFDRRPMAGGEPAAQAPPPAWLQPPGSLDCRSGTGTAADGVYTRLVGGADRREWLIVQVLSTSAAPAVVSPTMSAPAPPNNFGQIPLAAGEAVVFSRRGDMPWKGPVHIKGNGGVATFFWTEAQEYPLEPT